MLKHLMQRTLIAVTVSFALAGTSAAQQYPSKAVTLLVPYPAGGLSDLIARTVNPVLGKQLGQPVIVENIGGGSGSVAAQRALNSPADGHIIFQGSPNELILAPLANSAIKHKSEDFRLVQMISTAQIAFLARKDLPVNDVDSFLAYAQKMAKEGTPITFASVGPGSFYHLLGEHMSKLTNIPMLHIPYKGAAPAEQDLMGSQVDIFLAPYGKKYDNLHKQGKVKILAMLNSERREGVKDYPAISESKGLKNFTFNIWTGYFVKKDTPEPVVQALHKAITETLSDSEVRNKLEDNSLLMPKPLPLSAVGKAYNEGIVQFRAIAKSINLKPE